jgi:hypothetical protein
MSSRARAAAGLLLAALTLAVATACQVGPAPPGPAEFRTSAPPWDAPRDAVSYIDAAGLERLPLDFSGPWPYYVKLSVTIAGKQVLPPVGIGIDRVRAEQAALHTHSADGILMVEGRKAEERPTLRQFFTLWGVRYDERCLGDACGGLTVKVNGKASSWDPKLEPEALIEVTARR